MIGPVIAFSVWRVMRYLSMRTKLGGAHAITRRAKWIDPASLEAARCGADRDHSCVRRKRILHVGPTCDARVAAVSMRDA
jgi:hypothetical protein